MTPQSSFLYAAPILPEHVPDLRALLRSMNCVPGAVDPCNKVIPFGLFKTLHFARLLIVSDLAASDRAVYQLPVDGLPDYLVLMGEIDGDASEFQRELIRTSESGLASLFSHCADFSMDAGVDAFLQRSIIKPAATYVNWIGRTVLQEQEEEALQHALATYSRDNRLDLLTARQAWISMKNFVREQQSTGAISLTPQAETPSGWQVRNLAHLIAVPLMLLLLTPFLLLYLPFFLTLLRRWEKTDPAVAPPLNPEHASDLTAIENYDVTNQFSVFGSLKPGMVRLWSMRCFLWITNYTARHIFYRGGLARVQTIHFARWIYFDGGQRMLFSSIYDGSLESYMDDFINKVGFGLNITFSNGIGYPRTRWLFCDGCQDEQTFKRVLRRHQLPTEVWFNATPGLTAANKQRNSMIRAGIVADFMSEEQVRQWAALL